MGDAPAKHADLAFSRSRRAEHRRCRAADSHVARLEFPDFSAQLPGLEHDPSDHLPFHEQTQTLARRVPALDRGVLSGLWRLHPDISRACAISRDDFQPPAAEIFPAAALQAAIGDAYLGI